MTPRRRLLLALGLAIATGGCAVGNQLISSRGDYRLYRQARLAPTLEERLAAGNRYLHVAPNGPYAEELNAWFRATERAYLARAHDQLPKLTAYLEVVPDGPSVADVKARIEELETAAGFAEGRETARNQRVEALEVGLERAAAQRKAFISDLTTLVGLLAGVRSFNQPVSRGLPARSLRENPGAALCHPARTQPARPARGAVLRRDCREWRLGRRRSLAGS